MCHHTARPLLRSLATPGHSWQQWAPLGHLLVGSKDTQPCRGSAKCKPASAPVPKKAYKPLQCPPSPQHRTSSLPEKPICRAVWLSQICSSCALADMAFCASQMSCSRFEPRHAGGHEGTGLHTLTIKRFGPDGYSFLFLCLILFCYLIILLELSKSHLTFEYSSDIK